MSIRAASQPCRTGRNFTLTAPRSLAICLGVLLVALCSSSSVTAAERTIGHVVGVEEDWYLDGRPGRALVRGDDLPASGIIRIRNPSRYAYIILNYSDNNQTITKRCRNAGDCDQPILLPRAVQREASYGEIILDTIWGAIRKNPITPEQDLARSDDGVLREAVVQIKDGQVDLTPVFAEMSNGTYNVRLTRRMPDGKMAKAGPANSIKVTWNSAVANSNPTLNLQPGLYEIVLLENQGGELRPTRTSAWFLAGNLEQYAQTVAPFCEASRLTATWKNDAGAGTVSDSLRAFLIHLEAESQTAQPSKQ